MSKLLIIKQLQSKHLNQSEAGERLGLSVRQVRRLLRRVEAEGISGVCGKQQGGNRSHSAVFKEDVLSKVTSAEYAGFGPTFASEKLEEYYNLKVNKETLRNWMMASGVWKGRQRKKARIHQHRERRHQYGELVQIDGSHHAWFEGRGEKCCLIVFIDDATSRILGLRFEEKETTQGYVQVLADTLKRHGRPVAYYSDKHSIFRTMRPNVNAGGHYEDTRFQKVLRSLQIELICAHSSQAKGRVERANNTLQDRLVKELRLRSISTIEAANAYVEAFIQKHNAKFAVPAADAENAHRPVVQSDATLRKLLSVQSTRKLSKNLEFFMDHKIYQIKTKTMGYRLRYQTVTLYEYEDGNQEVFAGNERLEFTVHARSKPVLEADVKEINGVMDRLIASRQQDFIEVTHRAHSPCPV